MNYFKSNFALMQHHHWSIAELESMIPWERDIYIIMLLQYLEEQKEKLKHQKKK